MWSSWEELSHVLLLRFLSRANPLWLFKQKNTHHHHRIQPAIFLVVLVDIVITSKMSTLHANAFILWLFSSLYLEMNYYTISSHLTIAVTSQIQWRSKISQYDHTCPTPIPSLLMQSPSADRLRCYQQARPRVTSALFLSWQALQLNGIKQVGFHGFANDMSIYYCSYKSKTNNIEKILGWKLCRSSGNANAQFHCVNLIFIQSSYAQARAIDTNCPLGLGTCTYRQLDLPITSFLWDFLHLHLYSSSSKSKSIRWLSSPSRSKIAMR